MKMNQPGRNSRLLLPHLLCLRKNLKNKSIMLILLISISIVIFTWVHSMRRRANMVRMASRVVVASVMM